MANDCAGVGCGEGAAAGQSERSDRAGSRVPNIDVLQQMWAFPHSEAATAIRTVRASTALPAVRLAFGFLVLTAARGATFKVGLDEEGGNRPRRIDGKVGMAW